ncbi:hypothetical protein SSX86_007899 [Deinandra increscens subsp. villosa]|uniref:DUF8039 domain-containing protein n=1 Tax=Deinandra increscens subsp. villosa TaxID=3103831 RepID=A0AAP0H8D3_9ASTR
MADTRKADVKDMINVDMLQYYEVDEGRKMYVMNRMGMLLRSFRNKLYEYDIRPNLGKPKKLAKIPKRYRTIILNQQDWDNFVDYTQSDEYKVGSVKSKYARSMSVYNHRLGRGGYARLEQKLVESKVIDVDKAPSRALLWYKARKNKAGEIEDENVKAIGAEIHVTQLQAQLEKERKENQEKDEEVNKLKERMVEQDKLIAQILANLPPEGREAAKKKRKVRLKPKKIYDSPPVTETTPSPGIMQSIRCKLAYATKRQTVGMGTIHEVPLQDDCYKVSIDEVVVPASFLPFEVDGVKTLDKALKIFVPLPNKLCIGDSNEQVMTTPNQQNEDDNVKGQQTKKQFITRDDIVNMKNVNKRIKI